MAAARGIIVAAPESGSGKTIVTLGLLRHLRRSGADVASFKVGPDYIDPAFHRAASGRDCVTLDSWAMRRDAFVGLAAGLVDDAGLVIGEGVMGLFDGAADGSGSTAEISVLTGWPVVLVVDAASQGASAAALVHGFATFRDDVSLAAIIFNRVGSANHAAILARALAPLGIPLLGCIGRDDALRLPERHLGLVQAAEHGDLASFLDRAADAVAASLDIDLLLDCARPATLTGAAARPGLDPIGQRIAIARDEAFAFAYPHMLDGWRGAGAELVPFSPLADGAPDADADAVFLPGGYPELHSGRLAANRNFLSGLRAAAARGAVVYGECGGFMVLGESIVDAGGARHAMAGLLDHATSFASPRLRLGYRSATLAAAGPLGGADAAFRGHEFHYAALVGAGDSEPLFHCRDALGADLGAAGARRGTVMGSFVHLIDRADGVAGGA